MKDILTIVAENIGLITASLAILCGALLLAVIYLSRENRRLRGELMRNKPIRQRLRRERQEAVDMLEAVRMEANVRIAIADAERDKWYKIAHEVDQARLRVVEARKAEA